MKPLGFAHLLGPPLVDGRGAERCDATVLMIASVAMEAGGMKKSPRARAAVGAVVWFFIPMAISHAQVSSDTTHWIVNNERVAWRGESSKSDAMSASGRYC